MIETKEKNRSDSSDTTRKVSENKKILIQINQTNQNFIDDREDSRNQLTSCEVPGEENSTEESHREPAIVLPARKDDFTAYNCYTNTLTESYNAIGEGKNILYI